MYFRQQKRLVGILTFSFLLFCFSTYFISQGEQQTAIEFIGKGAADDQFINDHIDVPEIPVQRKVIMNDSDYEILYKKGLKSNRTRSKLVWHNKKADSPNYFSKDVHTSQVFKSEEKERMRIYSMDEQDRLRMFFTDWPSHKPRAAFYVLTSSTRTKSLQRMLQSVDKFFNDRFKYPIILFYEPSLTPMISTIRTWTNSTLFFQIVNFTIPEFLSEPVKLNIPCMSKISYRHMCRFNAKLVYEEPAIQELDYYWRLDDDSLLLSAINYDVFEYMRRNRLHYGYSWIFFDADSCVTGLWEATGRYIRENQIEAKFFKDWPKPRLYYNNFEISSTKMWLSEDYKRYVNYLDRLGGIYYSRWGDAPIHGIAVSMFLQKNQTHLFDDIGYQHNTYIHKAVSESSQ